MIPQVVYMIGHSKHKWLHFVELLTQHKINLLVDVRSLPQSRFSPHFNKKAMQASLAPIEYRHIPELGGKNPNPIAQMRQHIENLLIASPRNLRICLMCSEGNYLECHRHYMLTPLVHELGYQVQQILANGTLVLDEGPTPATLKKMAPYLPHEVARAGR